MDVLPARTPLAYALLLALLLGLGGALAQDARLSVQPAGEQRFDITTGVTELPSGGTIQDQETGVALEASWIRYREGAFIEAEGAVAEGDFGRFEAPSLRIDLEAGTLEATDGVTLRREGLAVEAASLRYHAEEAAVRFEEARGSEPDFEARVLLLDVDTGDALLLGPYRYAGEPFEMSDDRSDARLQLLPQDDEAERTAVFDARSEVDPELLARLDPLL